jgi:hypothetical protein
VLKYADIKPLFKKGDKNNSQLQTCTSFLTSFSKVFEKAMNLRLYQHINTNIILVNEQFGFETKSSTVKATCNLISKIMDTMNNEKKHLVAYFGIWKRTLIVLMTFYYLNFNFMQ